MSLELTNLLPENRARSLKREYFVRLLTVALALFTFVIVSSAAMLIPAHAFLQNGIAEGEQELLSVSKQATSLDEVAYEKRLAALSLNTKRITELSSILSPSKILSQILATPRVGIVLVGFAIDPPSRNAGGMTVTGRAKTRNSLREYQLSLEKIPFVSSANVPVSAYAKESDIDFTISVTLKKL